MQTSVFQVRSNALSGRYNRKAQKRRDNGKLIDKSSCVTKKKKVGLGTSPYRVEVQTPAFAGGNNGTR